MPAPVDRSARAREHNYDTEPSEPPPMSRPSRDLEVVYDALPDDDALPETVRNMLSPRGPDNDDVLYVDMNGESAAVEARALTHVAHVERVAHGDDEDTITVGSAKFKLAVDHGADESASREGIARFVATLGLPKSVAQDVEIALARATPGSRDELASIARTWARAERGESIPSRVVISGHSSGDEVWDGTGKNGSLRISDFVALAKAMPRAAAQIEDVHFSACNTAKQVSGEVSRTRWLDTFKNLRTVWGYAGFAPSAPTHHLQAWAAATRGRSETVALAPQHTAQAVAVWTRAQGYVEGGHTLPELRAREHIAAARYAVIFEGRMRVPSPNDPGVRADYETYQSLARRDDVPPAEARAFEKRASDLLRLRFYESTVRAKFASAYRAEIAAGFSAAGLDVPDFAKLTRAEALVKVRLFEQRASNTAAREVVRAREILQGLATLDPKVIPAEWC